MLLLFGSRACAHINIRAYNCAGAHTRTHATFSTLPKQKKKVSKKKSPARSLILPGCCTFFVHSLRSVEHFLIFTDGRIKRDEQSEFVPVRTAFSASPRRSKPVKTGFCAFCAVRQLHHVRAYHTLAAGAVQLPPDLAMSSRYARNIFDTAPSRFPNVTIICF